MSWRESYEEPSDHEKEMCLVWMERLYHGIPRAPDDWFSKERFLASLPDLDLTSTPGIPYQREAGTIGSWLKADGLGGFDPVQVERLWYDVRTLYEGNFVHTFRAFVKDEPHKIKKRAEGTWRLIMCASLSVQILWRMALKHQNDWLNSHAIDTPSAHGFRFCYGGWRQFKSVVESKSLRYTRDLTSWDLSSPGWIWRFVRELRERFEGPDDWHRTLRVLYKDAFCDAVIQFSNGIIVKQTVEGLMKSGLYVTISDNTLGMVAYHFLASLKSGLPLAPCIATGDDVLQASISESYLEELERLGCRVKEFEEKQHFMGTDFTSAPVPLYLEKHIVGLWTKDESVRAEVLDAYGRLWCHSETWFRFWVAVSEQLGIQLHSRQYYMFWYDSPWAEKLAYFERLYRNV